MRGEQDEWKRRAEAALCAAQAGYRLEWTYRADANGFAEADKQWYLVSPDHNHYEGPFDTKADAWAAVADLPAKGETDAW